MHKIFKSEYLLLKLEVNYTSSTEALVNNSSGVLFRVFKYLNTYVPNPTMDVVYPLKGPSSASMKCSANFAFNPSYFNISCPNIITFLPLAESFTFHSQVMTFVVLIVGKVKSTLTS